MRNADEINQYFWAGIRWNNPTKYFRRVGLNFDQKSRWDWSGQSLNQNMGVSLEGKFHNFWGFRVGLSSEFNDRSNTWLRGGPTFRKPHGWGGSLRVSTDERKVISQSVNLNGGSTYEGIVNGYGFNTTTTIRVNDGLNFSLGTSWRRSFREDQYVRTLDWRGSDRYIMSEIVRRNLNFTARVNYNITPDLTIQYYGQPFVVRGRYSDFKQVGDPVARDHRKRLIPLTDNQIKYVDSDESYRIDWDKNGSTDFTIQNPDFDFVQFRSNLVLRWEYIPGSEIYFVWAQNSTEYENNYSGNVWDSLGDNLWGDSLTNTFLVKATYRFSL